MDDTSASRFARLAAALASERSQVLEWTDKAFQHTWRGLSTTQVAAAQHEIDELSTPMMTLDEGRLRHNVSTMARWCGDAGVSHAPHGKTTMAPSLWYSQLLAGAWAITVANEPQLRVARAVGVPRVMVANMLIRPAGLSWVAREMDADPGFELMCWVDSVDAVQIMDRALRAAAARRPLPVLVEVGRHGARTGVRDMRTAHLVADAVRASPCLALAGVAGFEGAVTHRRDSQPIKTVDAFLRQMVALHRELVDTYEVEEAVLSAGGSAFFDRVAAVLGPEGGNRRSGTTRVVVRSGAYVVHDDGYYRSATPSARDAGPHFLPAMNLWARVISVPETGTAYLDAGKRDLPFDEGLPEVQQLRRVGPDGLVLTEELVGHEIVATNDQHALLRMPVDSPLRVGDVVRLGISHPCTAFDKWSLIPVLDDASVERPVVVDLVRTYF